MLTSRDIQVIAHVARYYVLTRGLIQRLDFPDDKDGRLTRRRLQLLVQDNYICRTHMEVVNPDAGLPCPVYYPSVKGCEMLTQEFEDERWLQTTTLCPQWHLLRHWIALSETHITLDAALAREDGFAADWLSEWDIANKSETAPEKRFRLYTLLRQDPRLVCAPDAAFILTKDGHGKVHYVEQDRATSGVRQIAVSKTPGYAELAARQLHRRHFPNATVETFAVLMVAPTERRRDALRKALLGKPGSSLWHFAAQPDLKPETFLRGQVWHPCEGDSRALLKEESR